jgi:uncharacterized membrane protein
VDRLYLALLISFQIVFLLVSLIYVVAFAYSARDARQVSMAENITPRSSRFLASFSGVARGIALFFFFWAFNTGSGPVVALFNPPVIVRIFFICFMMGFWAFTAVWLALSWHGLQMEIWRTRKNEQA